MESPIQPPREPSDPPPASEVDSTCPRWVMIRPFSHRRASSVADVEDKTLAASCTSTGRHFRVSFGLDPPPAVSLFYYDVVVSGADEYAENPRVIAAHGDCLLFELFPPRKRDYRYGETRTVAIDYFLYESSAGRPPSLSLLPACYYTKQYQRRHAERLPEARTLDGESGVLRRGEAEFVVAQLDMPSDDDVDASRDVAELCVLRLHHDRGWKLKKVPIVYDAGSKDDKGEELLRWWGTDAAFAVGERFLCWVDYMRGFLLCDMAADDASLRLRYVQLPGEPLQGNPAHTYDLGRPSLPYMEHLAPAGAGAVRYVSINSRCCCGGPGRTMCEDGRFSFTVTTWTMRLSMDEPMTWAKEGVLDCDELWSQSGYQGLPHVKVEYPVVSYNNPDVVCFLVRNDYGGYLNYKDRRKWTIEVDTRSKALLSVVPYNEDRIGQPDHCFSAKLRC